MDSIKRNNYKRIDWIDFSKAICIYLVVLGHVLTYEEQDECIARNFIYVFHLPVFFFVSGFLFRVKDQSNFYDYILSGFKSLIIPYIFLNLLALLLNVPWIVYKNSLTQSLYYFFIGHGHAPAGPAWFLLCLFWIKVQMFFLVKLNDIMLLIVSFLYGVLAVFFHWHLYWAIDASFMAMPLFVAGYLSKKIFKRLF